MQCMVLGSGLGYIGNSTYNEKKLALTELANKIHLKNKASSMYGTQQWISQV